MTASLFGRTIPSKRCEMTRTISIQQKRLYLIGALLLALGLASAALIYANAEDNADIALGYEMVNGVAYPTASKDSKAFTAESLRCSRTNSPTGLGVYGAAEGSHLLSPHYPLCSRQDWFLLRTFYCLIRIRMSAQNRAAIDPADIWQRRQSRRAKAPAATTTPHARPVALDSRHLKLF